LPERLNHPERSANGDEDRWRDLPARWDDSNATRLPIPAIRPERIWDLSGSKLKLVHSAAAQFIVMITRLGHFAVEFGTVEADAVTPIRLAR